MKLLTIAAAAMMLSSCRQDHAATVIERNKAFVASQLREPDSAKFYNLQVDGTGDWLCGMVAGRNAFGGMADALPFRADWRGEHLDMAPPEFLTDWKVKARYANEFEGWGCDIGPDHRQALSLRDDFALSPIYARGELARLATHPKK